MILPKIQTFSRQFFDLMDKNLLEQAKKIALADLRKCYRGEGILASDLRFSDFWARDTFWALFGVLVVGDFEKVRSCLSLFLRYQRKDGLIPRKISLDYNFLKYVFKKSFPRKNSRPIYFGNVAPFCAKDANALLVIAFGKYLKKTGDVDFVCKHWVEIKKSLDWLEGKKVQSVFVREFFLSNWMDTIFKRGAVLYTNVLYAGALRSLADMAECLGKEEVAIEYREKLQNFKKSFQEKFWNGNFFCDELGKKGVFDLTGNALAIIFDLANQRQAEKIVSKAEKIKKNRKEAKLHPINHPQHPLWKINPVVVFIGIKNYQNGNAWSWTEAVFIVAKIKINHTKDACENLEQFSQIIVQNGHIHENYHLSGKPFGSWFWPSAAPFAWGAGLFLWVLEELEKTQ